MLFAYLTGQSALEALLLLLIALAFDWMVIHPPFPLNKLPHPVRMIGKLIAFLDEKLNRESRANETRFFRGAIVTVGVTGLMVCIGAAIAVLIQVSWVFLLVELLLVVALLAQRSLYTHVLDVADGLRTRGLAGGRESVSKIVGRDPQSLDEHGVARAAIESCAENYSDGIVAPVFWYCVFGLPGILAYKAINTMDSMIGYRTPRYESFGKAAAKLDDIVNWVPARLSALYIVVAAGFAFGKAPAAILSTMIKDARKHRSPNAGWPEAAMAGALDVSLAGPRLYTNDVANDPWVGGDTARATETDIRRALRVFVLACLVNGLIIVVVAAGIAIMETT
jgi:adenosylcobinamide-phosphate synthase